MKFGGAIFALWLALACSTTLHAEEDSARDLTWDDLLPKKEAIFDDPFEKLNEEQLLDLGMVARIRYLLKNEKISTDGADAKEEKALVARLSEQGIDVDYLLSQRERVAAERRKRAEQVDEGIDGQKVRIPGYMLPLKRADGKVVEFLLVPWVGACIHTPPPPPNQMVHVDVPAGTEDKGRFAAVWIKGPIALKPGEYDLYLVDGSRRIKVAYTMPNAVITEYSSNESDVLSKVVIPEDLGSGHSWWQIWQTKISLLFTKTMTDIKDRRSSWPLFAGLFVALLYGVVHTLGPGHGKAVVISYFIGHGGSFGKGLRMGTQIAVFHVLSAVIVVWIMDFAVRQATGNAPSDYRLIKLVSYAAIATIGAFMLWKAIGSARLSHHHTHDLDHEKGDGHHAHAGCHACDAMESKKGPAGWLALAVGSVPCTGALLVLLFGMANDLLWPAILMVVAISLGMAMALSGVGILAIIGRNYVDRKLENNEEKQHRFATGARIAGAAFVLLIGLGLFSLTLMLERQLPSPPSDSTEAME